MDRRKGGLPPQLNELGELFEKHVGKTLNSPVVGQLRDKFDQWNDPAARLERRKRRASRAVTMWLILMLIVGTIGGLGFAGVIGVEETLAVIGSVAAEMFAVIFGIFAIRSGMRLRQLNRTEVPARPAPSRLPARESVAREPMERLAEAEKTFADLARQLGGRSQTALPAESVDDARNTAADAASALRELADRIQAIERARDAAPERERAALGEAISTLRTQLDSGLEGYGSLVAAAGQAVAESSGGHLDQHRQELTEATDHLAGLAIAVRELSAHNRG